MEETTTKTQNPIVRRFTREGDDVYKLVEWNKRHTELKDVDGKILLDKEVEVPSSWSDTAATIAAYKYLRKRGVGSEDGSETSIRQLVHRVAHTIRKGGESLGHIKTAAEGDTFEDELAYILLTQRGAFNSPVWFNVGLWHEYGITGTSVNFFWNKETNEVERVINAYEYPQGSACFIQSLDDDLASIFDLVKKESQLFKYGSGTGTNFSALRSKWERLSSGGTSSGVMSFLKVFDAGAAATKSGGTTRRAAKMVILNIDHPEIMDFIRWKAREEEKAKILIEFGGLPSDFNGEAYHTVSGQNSNNSVRVTDEFMKAVEEGGEWSAREVTTGNIVEAWPARQVMREIARAAWQCADPGMQYDTVTNKWHTCKASGRINASNPCSEYMFLDDSACNLASINLVKFLNGDGTFNIEDFRHTVDVFILAQEILVDFCSYPSRMMAQNSHDFRPLGLGYANLGAYLMRIGLPYDSDEGRSWAAAITAIMTGRAYARSARIAQQTGPFAQYQINAQSMLEVIDMHRQAAYQLGGTRLQPELMAAAKEDWDIAYDLGEKYGYRNAQATLLAPTGTIGPLMDVDTTGVEPEFALVKYKKLAGGGGYSIVNQSVPAALEKLGYNSTEIKEITDYILQTGGMEGAPHIRLEHLPIFDVASRVGNGKRFIRPMGHVDMMAAIQPFLSGAISKTVNMPEEVSIEDVEGIYIQAWKKGLKALAIYRDNCKASQPLTVGKKAEGKTEEPKVVYKTREFEMPKTREGITHSFIVGNHKVYLTANKTTDDKLGEIFLKSAREGSMVSGLLDTLARLMSKALQRGETVESLVDSLINMRFEPWGATDDLDIPFAKSLPDYIARWLGRRYLPLDRQVMMGIVGADIAKELEDVNATNIDPDEQTEPMAPPQEAPEPVVLQASLESMMQHSDSSVIEGSAPPCPTCGALMVRSGTCYHCRECGTTTGCS
ncbi:MAG: vitamin B12-dependent ribonucleotide reductase [bacterium]